MEHGCRGVTTSGALPAGLLAPPQQVLPGRASLALRVEASHGGGSCQHPTLRGTRRGQTCPGTPSRRRTSQPCHPAFIKGEGGEEQTGLGVMSKQGWLEGTRRGESLVDMVGRGRCSRRRPTLAASTHLDAWHGAGGRCTPTLSPGPLSCLAVAVLAHAAPLGEALLVARGLGEVAGGDVGVVGGPAPRAVGACGQRGAVAAAGTLGAGRAEGRDRRACAHGRHAVRVTQAGRQAGRRESGSCLLQCCAYMAAQRACNSRPLACCSGGQFPPPATHASAPPRPLT